MHPNSPDEPAALGERLQTMVTAVAGELAGSGFFCCITTVPGDDEKASRAMSCLWPMTEEDLVSLSACTMAMVLEKVAEWCGQNGQDTTRIVDSVWDLAMLILRRQDHDTETHREFLISRE